jgi:hypothetical protein
MPLNRKKQFNKLLRKSASPLVNIAGGAVREARRIQKVPLEAPPIGSLYRFGKKAGEKLAETVLGPIDYTTPFTPEEVEYQQSAPSGPPALEPPYRLPPRKVANIKADVWSRKSADPLPTMDTSSLTLPPMRDRSALGPTTPQPPTDPMDTGGLDRGDPTSFAPPTEELEPAWVKRERERDRKRLLSQTQRQLRKR